MTGSLQNHIFSVSRASLSTYTVSKPPLCHKYFQNPLCIAVWKGRGYKLDKFLKEIVPLLSSKFVLIIASGDVTIPRNTDLRVQRLPGFNGQDGGPNWRTITSHPTILHTFIENLDLTHPRVSSLPTGMVRHDYMACYRTCCLPIQATKLAIHSMLVYVGMFGISASQWLQSHSGHSSCGDESQLQQWSASAWLCFCSSGVRIAH